VSVADDGVNGELTAVTLPGVVGDEDTALPGFRGDAAGEGALPCVPVKAARPAVACKKSGAAGVAPKRSTSAAKSASDSAAEMGVASARFGVGATRVDGGMTTEAVGLDKSGEGGDCGEDGTGDGRDALAVDISTAISVFFSTGDGAFGSTIVCAGSLGVIGAAGDAMEDDALLGVVVSAFFCVTDANAASGEATNPDGSGVT
jgi:hypothetical protein